MRTSSHVIEARRDVMSPEVGAQMGTTVLPFPADRCGLDRCAVSYLHATSKSACTFTHIRIIFSRNGPTHTHSLVQHQYSSLIDYLINATCMAVKRIFKSF